MKTIILCLCSLSALSQVPAQRPLPVDSATGDVIYKKIESVDSASKETLYFRAKMWIAKNYKSAQDVIQMDDKENGVIIVKGRLPLESNPYDGYVAHTLTISLKDNKYKVEFTDLDLYWYVSYNQYVPGSPYWKNYLVKDCYPASEKLPKGLGWRLHHEMIINSTNEMDVIIRASLISLDAAMKTESSTTNDW